MLSSISSNWDWIVGNLAASISVAGTCLVAGFLAGRFFRSEELTKRNDRISDLKEKGEEKEKKIAQLEQQLQRRTTEPDSAPKGIEYPSHGLTGENILSALTLEAKAGESRSMAVVVPTGQRLRVRMKQASGTPDATEMSAWSFRLSPRNWQWTTYNRAESEQVFDAGPGDADMNITFHRRGDIAIEAYSAQSAAPLWERTLTVR